MKKRVVILILMMSCGCIVSFAQDSEVQNNSWLLGGIFKLESLRETAIANIKKYEGEIQKCNVTINKSESILSLAQQQGNVRAEEIAREALAKAQAAKKKNTELRKSAEFNKMRAENALARANSVLSDALSHPRIESIITDFTGRVSIKKPSGATMDFGGDQKGFLEKGDEIATFENSQAELQFLDGRGTISMGENSRVKMEEDNAGTQVMSVLQGKSNFRVEKLENFQKIMDERIEAYREDTGTVKDELKQKALQAFLKFKAFPKKFEVQTPTCVIADRGTEFVVLIDKRMGTELIVLEGSVEMRGKTGDKALIIEAGYKGTATKDGILSEPEKLDVSRIDKWWEEHK